MSGSARTGRSDLVRILDEFGELAARNFANRLGYRDEAQDIRVGESDSGHQKTDTEGRPPALEPPSPARRRPRSVTLLAPTAFESLEPESSEAEDSRGRRGYSDADLDRVLGPAERALVRFRRPPIAPWRRLQSPLASELAAQRPGRVDLARLVPRVARLEHPRRLPRLRRRAWAPEIVVWVDRSERLRLFFEDQNEICRELRDRCGSGNVEIRLSLDGPESELFRGNDVCPSGLADVAPETPILVLSDLGVYGSKADRRSWEREGRTLQDRGAKVCALVPVPPERVPSSLLRRWTVIPWESPAPLRRRHSGLARSVSSSAKADRLLRLLSAAVRVEIGLLRSARRELFGEDFDIGVEADIWRDGRLEVRSIDGYALRADVLDEARRRVAEEPIELRRRVVELVRSWHRPLPREIWFEELLSLASLGGLRDGLLEAGEVQESEEFWSRLALTVEQGSASEEALAELRSWLRRGFRRVPKAAARSKSVGGAWRRLQRWALDEGRAPVPSNSRKYLIGQSGEWLVAHPDGIDPGANVRSPIAALRASAPRITVTDRGGAIFWNWELDPKGISRQRISELSSLFTLRTDVQTLEIERITRPDWAIEAGRDEFGLWAEIELEVQGTEDHSGKGKRERKAGSARASRIRHRLRWIPPGEFWMGSPDDEPGRWDDEGPRHRVVISEGFWLGETPVTQELWEAVTGENPSRFKSPTRPVETISWDDIAERFLPRLAERLPREAASSSEWRLPTEAEWEYACRAGTETATYAGPIEILGENNAPVLDAIAWYGGNSGVDFELTNGWDSSGWQEKQHPHRKAGTHPVKKKLPNGWRLFDMLGNVWEWCADWFGPYDVAAAPDPVGPASGSDRVLRGGSWFDFAQRARAAYRHRYAPAYRFGNNGFRLARGRALQSGAERQDPAEPGGAERPPVPSDRAERGSSRAERASGPAERGSSRGARWSGSSSSSSPSEEGER
jgi:sulfatase modifying factor 1